MAVCADLLNMSEHVLHLVSFLGPTAHEHKQPHLIMTKFHFTLDCTDSMDQLMNSVVQFTGSTESSRIRVSVNVVAALLVKSNGWMFSLSNLSLTLN